jgi:hypothetical protein
MTFPKPSALLLVCVTKTNMRKKIKKSGFIALIFVLIVGAVGLAVAVSLLFLGVGSSRSSLALNESHQALALADGCAERALEVIRITPSTTGTFSITVDSVASCAYTIIDKGGNVRWVNATGTVNGTVRKVQVRIDQIRPKIRATSWEDVADFPL